jgi:copper transport protein
VGGLNRLLLRWLTAVVVSDTGKASSGDPIRSRLLSVTRVNLTLRIETFSLQVSVSPARVGNNSVHPFAYAPDGKPVPVGMVCGSGTARPECRAH